MNSQTSYCQTTTIQFKFVNVLDKTYKIRKTSPRDEHEKRQLLNLYMLVELFSFHALILNLLLRRRLYI